MGWSPEEIGGKKPREIVHLSRSPEVGSQMSLIIVGRGIHHKKRKGTVQADSLGQEDFAACGVQPES